MRDVDADEIARDSGPFGSRFVGVGFGLIVFAVWDENVVPLMTA